MGTPGIHTTKKRKLLYVHGRAVFSLVDIGIGFTSEESCLMSFAARRISTLVCTQHIWELSPNRRRVVDRRVLPHMWVAVRSPHATVLCFHTSPHMLACPDFLCMCSSNASQHVPAMHCQMLLS
eukprot:TRINITY_DN62751_c0_g1_i1.p1 TRINITY_DN62751_c0_g1~~TRINITY_DN62751_c0_g1_i1.p1  ORF type:complete len:124 (+),score=9.48 TRINITY_DN62751_c0_g1_i1:14-385(+)